MRLIHIIGLMFCGLLFFYTNVFADSLKATVDRTELSINETVMLTVTLDGSLDSNGPDWQVLNKYFTVLGNSTSQQLAIVNGKSSKITVWNAVLAPKHEGQITIPSLTIDKLKSDPISIQVNSIKQSLASGQTPAIFLQTKIEPKEAYVQQQLVYTVSLYHNAAILSGGFSAPELPNAVIKPLGNDTEYQAKVNGRSYQVIQRQYVIFPQTSGKMTLMPSLFGGTIAEPITRDDLLDDSTFIGSSTKPVQIRSNPIELNIKPKPASFGNQQPWLPAKNVSLKQSWSIEPPVFRVGEPVTLTLTLRAEGVSADQLPLISLPTINNLNVYPDRPVLTTTAEGSNTLGVREQKIALIPTKAGTITIPAITLNWWNIQTDRMETITIPAQTFNALPAINVQATNQATPMIQTAPQNTPAMSTTPMPAPKLVEKGNTNYWPWALAALFFVAWLFTLILFLHRKKNLNSQPSPNTPDSLGEVRKQLQQACDANNPEQAKNAIMAWAKAKWPNVIMRGLNDVADHLYSMELKSAIKTLDRLLYADEHASWNGQKFWQVFQNEKAQAPQNVKKNDALPPLYPKS